MHVDGFRFDEGSVLHRGADGAPMDFPPVVWGIELSEKLADTKVIAEAWDAGGLYDVGNFPGSRWSDWNGRFRDDVRRFVRGDPGLISTIATRISGSMDMYEGSGRGPANSVNFITAHDGFTLYDLVAYNEKHNDANGEGNRDGIDDNLSWNCGVEGPTDDPAVERLRIRQAKNFLTLTLMALGAPMLLMGDEVRRTQRGNNNAYCQDSEISWFDWTLLDKHRDFHRFVKIVISIRLRLGPVRDAGLSLNEFLRQAKIHPHGVKLDQPDWGDGSHTLVFTVLGLNGRALFHVMINAYWEPLAIELPPRAEGPHQGWRRLLDTYLESPDDIYEGPELSPVQDESYLVQPRSLVILVARLVNDSEGIAPHKGAGSYP
jgi:glycogen operon protein